MANVIVPPRWLDPRQHTTEESVYLNRRQILAALGLGSLTALTGAGCAKPKELELASRSQLTTPAVGDRFRDAFPARRNPAYELGNRPLTPEETAAANNNFYEFTTDKARVWELAQTYTVDRWQVEIGGLVRRERVLDLDDLFTRFPLEERLYRFRCVERWAMQVPWTGFPLRSLIDWAEPLSTARYVRFVSFYEPARLPGIGAYSWYPWPYFEALRLDEARNPLAFAAVGIYGHPLPMQHGAPWRIVVPWKYGYKNPKSIVRIEFTKNRPETFWHQSIPHEYGFYSNVDPHRRHPRWSQAEETDIGTEERRATLLYNGYADEVGSLYTGKEA